MTEEFSEKEGVDFIFFYRISIPLEHLKKLVVEVVY